MVIRKSALVVIRNGKLLLVRKHGSKFYLMPGGKPEGFETSLEALGREIKEELGCMIEPGAVFLGKFEDFAAEQDATVLIELYSGNLRGVPVASSEIEELVWVSAGDAENISPIVKNKIVPFLVSNGMLS